MKFSAEIEGVSEGARIDLGNRSVLEQEHSRNGKAPAVAKPPSRWMSRFFAAIKVVLGLVACIVSAEGFRVLLPSLGWKLYHAIWPLYYVPLARRLDIAMILAFVTMIVVLWTWHYVLRQLTGVNWIPSEKKWYRDGEGLFRSGLAIVLLFCDAALVYMGICGMTWGSAKFSAAALLMTIIYACLMVGVTYASIDSGRAFAEARRYVSLLLIAASLGLSGCEPPREQVFNDRESEFVATILLDLSGSFVEELSDGGWDFLQTVLEQYFRHRAGSGDDLIIIAKISADTRTLLWQGTPRDLRERFPTPEEFKSFLVQNVDSSGSRVHEAISESLRFTMADQNVASGHARSALLVLSDMVQQPESEESEEEVTRMLTDYGRCGGVVGLFYVDEELVFPWKERLRQCGVRHTVCDSSERKPIPPNFE